MYSAYNRLWRKPIDTTTCHLTLIKVGNLEGITRSAKMEIKRIMNVKVLTNEGLIM